MNPMMYIAERLKEINEYYKENYTEDANEVKELQEKIRLQVQELSNYAKNNNVPFVYTAKQIFMSVHNLEAGEVEEDEYEESSYYEDESDYC